MFTYKKNSKNASGVDAPAVAKLKRTNGIGQKRPAFGDLTNATKDKKVDADGKKRIPLPFKPTKPITKPIVSTNAVGKAAVRKKTEKKNENVKPVAPEIPPAASILTSSQESTTSGESNQILTNLTAGVLLDREEEDFSFVVEEISPQAKRLSRGSDKDELLSIDQEHYTDVFNVGIYAQDIFDYYKRRERMFKVPLYLSGKRCTVTPIMRAILVDWMVEIQENFELNHETLYLAVKLSDMYLSRITAKKEAIQLIGAVAIFIASKFDERCPPLIEDFTYICDHAFERDEFIEMEMELLKKVDFDLGIPISYRFLRRYAKVARLSMVTLTLARYILEMSLMEYELIVERDSMIAAAALYIAMKMKKEGDWEGDVIKASGYTLAELKRLIMALNKMLTSNRPSGQLTTISRKYSHIVFHEVAKIQPLTTAQLL